MNHFTVFEVAKRSEMPEAFELPSQQAEQAVLYSRLRDDHQQVIRYWAWGLEDSLLQLAEALETTKGIYDHA